MHRNPKELRELVPGDGSTKSRTIELAYDREELPEWELVLELSRRAVAGERQVEDRGEPGAS